MLPVTVSASLCPLEYRNRLTAPVENHIDTVVYGRHTVVPNISGIGLEFEFAYAHTQKGNLIG